MTSVDESVALAGSPLEGLIGRVAAPIRSRSNDSAASRSLRRLRSYVVVTDAAVIMLAIGVAFFARFGLDDDALAVAGLQADYWLIAPLVATAWIFALSAYRTRDARVFGAGTTEYRRVVNATAMVFGLLAILFLALKTDVSRGFFLVAFPLGLAGLIGSRWAWRNWLTAERRRGRYLLRAIVVGQPGDARYVVHHIERRPGSAYEVAGVILDDGETGGEDGEGIVVGGRRVPAVGTLSRVAEAASMLRADAVIVAGQPSGGGQFLRDLGWELERTDAELVLASRLTNVAGPRIHFRPVEGLPLMHVELPSYEGGKHVVKRLFDVAASGLALLLLAPLLAVIALLVRAEDGAPALFRQSRIGRNGESFDMLKFRSMVPDAEARLAELLASSDGNGVLFKLKDDPRVTRIGRILRKYSLDELPQLWNVLIGDMSLVGPRPPLEREVREYDRHVLRRLYIKPGITGMWQINGRSLLSWEESVRLDLYYVENWSLAGDLVILWRTLKVLVKPVGAF